MQNQVIKDLKLIHCPICADSGKKVVLGGTDDQGNFVVKRFAIDKANYTKVHSKEYGVECSGCNEVIFIHKRQ